MYSMGHPLAPFSSWLVPVDYLPLLPFRIQCRIHQQFEFSSTNNDSEIERVARKWGTPQQDIVAKDDRPNLKNFWDNMNRRLRDNAVSHLDNKVFWPPAQFDRIFNRPIIEQIVKKLIDEKKLPNHPTPAGSDSKTYWTNRICNHDGRQYRHILAILVLVGRSHYIKACMDLGLSDDVLPLCGTRSHQLDQLEGKDRDWGNQEKDLFQEYQWRFKVQVLGPTRSGDVPHYHIGEGEIKPWIVLPDGVRKSTDTEVLQFSGSISPSDLENLTLGGGFGEVLKVIIHPWQHRFGALPHTKFAPDNVFALKRLRVPGNEKKDFEEETKMLKRFGGKGRNIVTLLATIIDESTVDRTEYYLLFPWAEGDLRTFWQTKGMTRDYKILKWVAEQCLGIVEAVNYIHNPPDAINEEGQPLFGRHGDIKPQNVLWFKGDTEILILSDLGIADVHRENSRSNLMPTMNVTREYRPPERDIKDVNGLISRSFDIWTLGCLFLEFTIWILCGWDGIHEFQTERCSPYQVGSGEVQTRQYFDGSFLSDDDNKFEFKLKENVIKRFNELHKHEKCSQYLHDFLNLIQTKMLLVHHKKRIKAAELHREMAKLNKKCEDRAYCLEPVQHVGTYLEAQTFISPLNLETLAILRH